MKRRLIKPYKLDYYTFGNSKAEVTLVKILMQKNNKWQIRFVSKFLNFYNKKLRMLQSLPLDRKTKLFLFELIREHSYKNIDESNLAKEEPEITTYLKNCLTKRLRNFLKYEKENRN